MFSLVVVVFAVLLTAGLIAVTIFYGGTAFASKSSELVGQDLSAKATQLKAASELYQQDSGAAPATISDLVTGGYLNSDFTAGTWSVGGPWVTTDTVTDAQCAAFNKTQNISVTPSCSDPAYAGLAVCCSE